VFVNNGSLYGVVAADKTQPFTAPAVIVQGSLLAPVSSPDLDMSVHGVGYVAFAQAGGGGSDVRVARLAGGGQGWTTIDGPLDLDVAHDAGSGAGRPSVAVSADGTALVAWGESGGVPMRRVGRSTVSSIAIGASDSDLQGQAPGRADSPDVALSDDSSYGEVVLRQSFDNGGGQQVSRLIGRHLVADDLRPAEPIDGLDFPAPEGASNPVLAMDGRGRGMAGGSRDASLTPTSALLREDMFAGGQLMGALNNGGTPPLTTVAVGENNAGAVAWLQAPTPAPDGVVAAGRYESSNTYDDEAQLSPPDFGPVNSDRGFYSAADRTGDAVVAFTQGPPAARRVVVSVYDRFPGRARPRTPKTVHSQTPLLRWIPAVDLLGAPTYQVILDGREIGQTQDASLRVPNTLSYGKHTWRVDTIDLHGQQRQGKSRRLTVG
jgi:hypothetical protein